MAGRLKNWRAGRMEGQKMRKVEGLAVGRLGGWKAGKGWKIRILEFLHNSTEPENNQIT